MHYLVIPYLVIFIFYLITVFQDDSNIKYTSIVYFFYIALFIFYFALLSQPVSGDSYRYSLGFHYLGSMTFSHLFSIPEIQRYGTSEYGFRLLNWLIWHVSHNYKFFITVIFFLFIGIVWKAIRQLYKGYEQYYVFFSLLLYPYFIAFATSGKRQGLAMALMFLAIAYFFTNKNKQGYISLFLIPLIHYGSLIVIPFILLFVYFKNKNILFIASLIYVVSMVMSVTELNKSLVDLISTVVGNKQSFLIYIDDDFASKIHYRTGFRIDFTLFSFLPIALYTVLKKSISKSNLPFVREWLALYLLLNSIYQFLSFIPFNDRIASYSWFILPVVCYEILKSNHEKYALLGTIVFMFAGVILLQIYTGKYFEFPEILI